MSALNRILARARSGEEGWLIIEIMIGAVTLIIAGLAIYAGLDRASSASGRNRNRSVAAFLAQQDQERLRSLDTTVLTGYIKTPNVQTINVGGNNYTVKSTVQWANDSNGTSTGCASTTAVATYLRITSTVTDPTNKNGPVSLDSLLSPRSDQGGAAAQIVDRSGTTGVQGIPVTLDEAPALSDTTDTNGCAQFGFLRGTDWHVSFTATGYVDKDGNNAITHKPLTVVTGSSSVTQFMYDQAGAIQTGFRDQTGAANTARGRGMTAFQSNMTGVPNQERSWFTGTSLSDSASATAQNLGTFTSPTILFPFTSSYSVWAGSCDAAKPTLASDIRPATVTPGGTVSTSPNYLVEPKLTVTVKRKTSSGGSATNLQNADVYVTDVCNADYPKMAATNSSGQTTSGYPYGLLTVCADDNVSRYQTGTVTNTNTGSSITLTIGQYSGGSPSGSCPR